MSPQSSLRRIEQANSTQRCAALLQDARSLECEATLWLDIDQARPGSYRAILRAPCHNSTGESMANARARSLASASSQYISLASSTVPSRVSRNAMKYVIARFSIQAAVG